MTSLIKWLPLYTRRLKRFPVGQPDNGLPTDSQESLLLPSLGGCRLEAPSARAGNSTKATEAADASRGLGVRGALNFGPLYPYADVVIIISNTVRQRAFAWIYTAYSAAWWQKSE